MPTPALTLCIGCERLVPKLVPSRMFIGLLTDAPCIANWNECPACDRLNKQSWTDTLAGVRRNLIFPANGGPSRRSAPIIDATSLAMRDTARRLLAHQ
jgi:hypothetical protein